MPPRPPMHPDQLTPTAATVRGLLREQYPAWAALPVRAVESPGTVNALFRVGDALVARLRLEAGAPGETLAAVESEVATARRLLAAGLPVATPEPLAIGAPGNGWPIPWSIWRWIPGHTAYDLGVGDDIGVARGIAHCVQALRAVDTSGEVFAGGRRGGRLRDHDATVAAWIDDAGGMVDTAAVTDLWRRLRDTPHDPGHDTFTHGDLMPGNLVVAPGRLVAVLDAEIAGVADPAVDLAPAWNLLAPAARAVFRTEVDVDDDTWRRGQAWSLVQAVGALAYYRVTNPVMSTTAASTLAALLAG